MEVLKNTKENPILTSLHMQLLAKLHAHATVHAIFEEMQLGQFGCRSTRLDFRNAFLGDEDPPKNNQLYITR